MALIRWLALILNKRQMHGYIHEPIVHMTLHLFTGYVSPKQWWHCEVIMDPINM